MAKNKKKGNNKNSNEQSKPTAVVEETILVDEKSASPSEDLEKSSNETDIVHTVNELERQLAHLKIELAAKDKELIEKDTIIEENAVKLKNAESQILQKEEASKHEINGDYNNGKSNDDLEELKTKLQDAEKERDESKSSYNALLSKLSSMKSVFSKMKEAQSELELTKESLESLTEENNLLNDKVENLNSQNLILTATIEKLTDESNDLNNECDRLSTSLTALRKEFQSKEDALQDEKYSLENVNSRFTKRINELKAEINEVNLVKDELLMGNKSLALKIEELDDKILSNEKTNKEFQKIVDDLRATIAEKDAALESSRMELTTHVTKSNNSIEQLEAEKIELNGKVQESISKVSTLEEELVKLEMLKSEVNSKQLIIGKLRHEAIILNEHLTKSLTMLKQQSGSSDNSIDKELISNVIISFLQFPRGDTKKFEALQLISALLGWDESKKVAAGLTHTQSTKDSPGEERTGRQSFVSLWTEFLEKESTT